MAPYYASIAPAQPERPTRDTENLPAHPISDLAPAAVRGSNKLDVMLGRSKYESAESKCKGRNSRRQP